MNRRKMIEYTALVLIIICAGVFICLQIFVFNNKGESAATTFKETSAEIVRGDISKKQVIFTFDGGSGTQSINEILDTLKKHHVEGSFFITGKFVDTYPDVVKRIIADGHEIFNHTYNHPYLTQLPEGRIAFELKSMDDALQRIAGVSSKPYFRAPYGDRDNRVLDIAAKSGYRSVYWTDDARDWEEPVGMSASEVQNKIMANVKSGEIFLLHIGDTITGKIIDDVFNQIEARGYRVVSLTQGR